MPKRTGRPWQRIKARVIRRDRGICHICGRPGADTADHLVPVARGGAWYDPANLAAAHRRCNLSRGARSVGVARREARMRQPAGWSW